MATCKKEMTAGILLWQIDVKSATIAMGDLVDADE